MFPNGQVQNAGPKRAGPKPGSNRGPAGVQVRPRTPPSIQNMEVKLSGLKRQHLACASDAQLACAYAGQIGELEEQLKNRRKKHDFGT